MREHEIYSHALDKYEEIAREYPDTSIAPKALYRAACSSYHQSNLNEWWRDHDKEYGYRKRASRLMARLARKYPRHSLAHAAAKYAKVFRVEES
jgi:outer membrane protein assembly factor BamD (BamD/ComL family)